CVFSDDDSGCGVCGDVPAPVVGPRAGEACVDRCGDAGTLVCRANVCTTVSPSPVSHPCAIGGLDAYDGAVPDAGVCMNADRALCIAFGPENEDGNDADDVGRCIALPSFAGAACIEGLCNPEFRCVDDVCVDGAAEGAACIDGTCAFPFMCNDDDVCAARTRCTADIGCGTGEVCGDDGTCVTPTLPTCAAP
ncbi:MAG TPA: hypothetical protein VGF99_21455, partial [Myxococcota bacterium]